MSELTVEMLVKCGCTRQGEEYECHSARRLVLTPFRNSGRSEAVPDTEGGNAVCPRKNQMS